MAAPIRAVPCRTVQRIIIWLKHHRLKHTNSWRDVKRCSDIEVQCGNDVLRFSSGKMARFADGAATVQFGNSSVLVTAVSKKETKPQSFLPLTVDYRQKAAAAGRIPTNHLRREMGPTDKEILTSRVIDRSIRPLFPPDYYCSTQVMCNLLAVDGANDPDILSINAASAALAVSDIPWNGPVGAVRIGMDESGVLINPTRQQLQKSRLNLILAGTTRSKIVMLEGQADQVEIMKMRQALSMGLSATQKIIEGIQRLTRKVGKPKRIIEAPEVLPQEIQDAVHSFSNNFVRDILYDDSYNKIGRDEALRKVKDNVINYMKESFPDNSLCTDSAITSCYYSFLKKTFRDLVLDEDRRCDGRRMDEIREVECEVDLFQPLHGSALFQRGQTQVLCTVTYDSPESAIKADPIHGAIEKNFMLHYEFPPYATNETGRGGIGRRELGHGALAEKGLRPVLPDQSDFTIRLTSEVLESNGSSSMASVCGGSLALMDAGVHVKEAAAGIAMGLVTRTDGETGNITEHKVLTDLLGMEDYMGDMDFKVACTARGVTAIQADVKLPGVPFPIIIEALDGGFNGTKTLLGIMNKTISSPRKAMKTCGPVTEKLVLDQGKQSRLLGLGGFNVKKLKAETGVTISRIDESSFRVFAPNPDAMAEAKEVIENLLKEQSQEPTLEFGAIYTGKVTEIRDFGVMVELHPKLKPILLHNSQLDHRKVSHASSLGIELGDQVKVKYFGRDPSTGNHRISRKVLQAPSLPRIKNLTL